MCGGFYAKGISMQKKSSRPKKDAAYKTIASPLSKRDALLEALRDYDVIEHGGDEDDYDYLGEDGVIFEVENENGESLFIELSDAFVLYFDGWHNRYGLQEYEFQYLLEDMNDLLKNRKCAVTLSTLGKWAGSVLSDGVITSEDDKDIILHGMFGGAVSDKISEQGGTLRAVYRDNSLSVVFDFEADK